MTIGIHDHIGHPLNHAVADETENYLINSCRIGGHRSFKNNFGMTVKRQDKVQGVSEVDDDNYDE